MELLMGVYKHLCETVIQLTLRAFRFSLTKFIITLPYNGKSSMGLIFENFKSSEVFSKIFFRKQ